MEPPRASLKWGIGIQAALLLARGRAEGALLLAVRGEDPVATANRSFWAAAICVPGFLCLELYDMAAGGGISSDAAHVLALRLFGYAIGWVGFAVLSHTLALALGRGASWPRFIAAWNWCNVVQYLLAIGGLLPTLLGVPGPFGAVAFLVSLFWSIWLEWFATRLTLGLNGVGAAAFVGIDLAIAQFLDAVVTSLRSG